MPANRDSGAAAVATIVIVIVLVLGFLSLGGPSSQRLRQADSKRIMDLRVLAIDVNARWNASHHVLPSSLEEATAPMPPPKDPITGSPFEYRILSTNQYELCSIFATDTQRENYQGSRLGPHPKGHYCLQFDATRPVEGFDGIYP